MDGMVDVSCKMLLIHSRTHGKPILLLRHELAARGHLLHVTGHCRRRIQRRSPGSSESNPARTPWYSSRAGAGAGAQYLSPLVEREARHQRGTIDLESSTNEKDGSQVPGTVDNDMVKSRVVSKRLQAA